MISEARTSRGASGAIATGIPALTLQAPTQDLDAAFLEYQKILERSGRASYEKRVRTIYTAKGGLSSKCEEFLAG